MAKALGTKQCDALPVFRAFTGCNAMLCFGGRGKKIAWYTCKLYEDVTPAFCTLVTHPSLEAIE